MSASVRHRSEAKHRVPTESSECPVVGGPGIIKSVCIGSGTFSANVVFEL